MSVLIKVEKTMNGVDKATASNAETVCQTHEETEKKEKDVAKKVPFYKLFSFADSKDIALMVIGSVGAAANGACMPLLAILLEVACWMVTGERQAARMRNLYLKTILRQDVSFFDKEVNTGEVVGRMSGDTVLILDAMGEKVGQFIQLVFTFLGGFVIAFIKGWLLTLVMLSSIPLLYLLVHLWVSLCQGWQQNGKLLTQVQQLLWSKLLVLSEQWHHLLEKNTQLRNIINLLALPTDQVFLKEWLQEQEWVWFFLLYFPAML